MTAPRTSKLVMIAVFVVQFLFFGYIALHRFVDGDEGFYLMASRLVLMHKKPYIDFFYTQTPLLPYIYALFLRCFGVTWFTAKLSAALLTALLGTAILFDVTAHTQAMDYRLDRYSSIWSKHICFCLVSARKNVFPLDSFLICCLSYRSRISANLLIGQLPRLAYSLD